MDCTLQIFLRDQWVDCAHIELNGGLCRWDHLIDYAIGHPDAPVSLTEPVDLDFRAARSLPAFLYDLVPQGAGRRFMLAELNLADGPVADFPLVCAGAFNPIGRVRVAEAVRYFEAHVARHPDALGLPGLTVDEVVVRSACSCKACWEPAPQGFRAPRRNIC